jgi:hypothetical protein
MDKSGWKPTCFLLCCTNWVGHIPSKLTMEDQCSYRQVANVKDHEFRRLFLKSSYRVGADAFQIREAYSCSAHRAKVYNKKKENIVKRVKSELVQNGVNRAEKRQTTTLIRYDLRITFPPPPPCFPTKI